MFSLLLEINMGLDLVRGKGIEDRLLKRLML